MSTGKCHEDRENCLIRETHETLSRVIYPKLDRPELAETL